MGDQRLARARARAAEVRNAVIFHYRNHANIRVPVANQTRVRKPATLLAGVDAPCSLPLLENTDEFPIGELRDAEASELASET